MGVCYSQFSQLHKLTLFKTASRFPFPLFHIHKYNHKVKAKQELDSWSLKHRCSSGTVNTGLNLYGGISGIVWGYNTQPTCIKHLLNVSH